MKTFLTQSIATFLVLGLVVLAGTVSAGNPAVTRALPCDPLTSGYPSCLGPTNTPFPVNTAFGVANDQTKIGGLVVEAFIAKQNAAFDQKTGVQGILTGNTAFTDNPLSFGGSGNNVNLAIAGTAYARELALADGKATLYSAQTVAPAGEKKALCATKLGVVVLCPTKILPPTVASIQALGNSSGTYGCADSITVYTDDASATDIAPGMHIWLDSALQVPFDAPSIRSINGPAYTVIDGDYINSKKIDAGTISAC